MLHRQSGLRVSALWLTATVLLAACRTVAPLDDHAPASLETTFVVITDSIAADQGLESQIQPFRDEMASRVSEVIAYAPTEITRAKPEGRLGNLTADAMLLRANAEYADSIHMAITNNGGLRVPIGPGDITVGNVYELMPFENRLVVLTMNGAQVDSLANQLAGIGGEAIAGFTFAIDGNGAYDLRVHGQEVESDKIYRLVTSDFVADGGDRIITITPLYRTALPVLLRDVFIDYFRELGTLEPQIEGRIVTR
jgi:2',3'-cyclic-nucleotide 2'-phosphodiesterase (5'-nucleotidase family)